MNHSETIRYTDGRQPACTRQQAAELLDSIRAEYQALPASERWLVGGVMQAVVRGTSQGGITPAQLERRLHPRGEFGLASLQNVAYSVLRKANAATAAYPG